MSYNGGYVNYNFGVAHNMDFVTSRTSAGIIAKYARRVNGGGLEDLKLAAGAKRQAKSRNGEAKAHAQGVGRESVAQAGSARISPINRSLTPRLEPSGETLSPDAGRRAGAERRTA